MVRRLSLLARPAGRKWGSRQSVQPANAGSTDTSAAAMETASLGKLLRDGVSDAMVRAVHLWPRAAVSQAAPAATMYASPSRL
jgi:hypothetical protein